MIAAADETHAMLRAFCDKSVGTAEHVAEWRAWLSGNAGGESWSPRRHEQRREEMRNLLSGHVFLTAWRKAARFDASRGRLSTWLMTIAHNLAVDRLRRDTGVTRPTLVLVDDVPDAPGVDEEGLLLERDAAVRALSCLSDAERLLLTRAYFRGLTAREIAEADGIPLGTVKTRLRAALIKVRRANDGKEPS